MCLRSKQIVGWLLIVIFALFYANICFSFHGHVINGVTIVHSHFHDKSHTDTYKHSPNELTLIFTLSLFHSLQANFGFSELVLFLILQTIILSGLLLNVCCNYSSFISLRGPPACPFSY